MLLLLLLKPIVTESLLLLIIAPSFPRSDPFLAFIVVSVRAIDLDPVMSYLPRHRLVLTRDKLDIDALDSLITRVRLGKQTALDGALGVPLCRQLLNLIHL